MALLLNSNRNRIWRFLETTTCPRLLQQVVDLIDELQGGAVGVGTLPLDLLCRVASSLQVAEKLTCLSLVSRLFNRVVRESASWSHVTLTSALSARIEDPDFTLLSLSWVQVRFLTLSNCHVGERALYLTIPRCLALHELRLSFCPFVSDRTLAGLSRCRELKSLHLTCCESLTDQALVHVGQCTSLEALSLIKVDITDVGLKSVTQLPLQRLSLRGCEISDKGVMLFRNLTRVRSLLVSECEEVGDLGIRTMLGQCAASICELNLAKSAITDNVCSAIANCVNLTHLCLDACKVTDAGLTLLARNCLDLKHLSVGWVKEVSDESVRHFSNLGLCFLNLQHCKITDNSLSFLSQGTTRSSLETLFLNGCHLLTDTGVTSLKTMEVLDLLSLVGCHRLSSRCSRHLPQAISVRI